ncbi:MAG: cadherin repeat domain-containing protein [Pirellulaceae bacterium]
MKLKSHVAFDHEVTNQVEFTLTAIDSLGFAVSRDYPCVEDENEFSPEFRIMTYRLMRTRRRRRLLAAALRRTKIHQSLRFRVSRSSLSWDDRFEIDPHTGVIKPRRLSFPISREASSYHRDRAGHRRWHSTPDQFKVPITITIEDVNDVPLGLLRPQSPIGQKILRPTTAMDGRWAKFRAADEELRDLHNSPTIHTRLSPTMTIPMASFSGSIQQI